MANVSTQRIKKKLKDLIKSEEVATGVIKVELVNDNYTELKGEIVGPPDTPYEGGNFVLDIKVPETYPFNPPKIQFITKIWHPNICYQTWDVCIDILANEWTATMTLRTVLLSIQALLSAPEPDDPLNEYAATQCIENAEMFQMTARYWTNAYAGGPHVNKEFDDKIRRLMEMDLAENEFDASLILAASDWDFQKL